MAQQSRSLGRPAFLAGLFAPVFLAGGVIAQDIPSAAQFTQTTQIWGQAILDQKLTRVQHKLSADIICNYENQLAKNTAYTMEQAEVIASIDAAPAHLVIERNETLAVVCPRTK